LRFRDHVTVVAAAYASPKVRQAGPDSTKSSAGPRIRRRDAADRPVDREAPLCYLLNRRPIMTTHNFTVRAEWDSEAKVWFVADSDVPGLATGAATLPELLTKLQAMIPELIELNHHMLDDVMVGEDIPVELITTKSQSFRLHH
jgi:predicted RNase H-like HicB family nuclease